MPIGTTETKKPTIAEYCGKLLNQRKAETAMECAFLRMTEKYKQENKQQ
jgi:hypothetical protein